MSREQRTASPGNGSVATASTRVGTAARARSASSSRCECSSRRCTRSRAAPASAASALVPRTVASHIRENCATNWFHCPSVSRRASCSPAASCAHPMRNWRTCARIARQPLASVRARAPSEMMPTNEVSGRSPAPLLSARGPFVPRAEWVRRACTLRSEPISDSAVCTRPPCMPISRSISERSAARRSGAPAPSAAAAAVDCWAEGAMPGRP
mmetsp:Transcript_15407/g.39090  ORF Transcript_15407/g.39090 Transcript_15407/m.39090 type:complete len:212 (+) Transcript_15407:1486-2121(+)